MNRNPSYENVRVGDQYVSSMSNFKGKGWYHVSTVVRMDPPEPRFKPMPEYVQAAAKKPIPHRDVPMDRVVYVDIMTSTGIYVDRAKRMWVSQLLEGKI